MKSSASEPGLRLPIAALLFIVLYVFLFLSDVYIEYVTVTTSSVPVKR